MAQNDPGRPFGPDATASARGCAGITLFAYLTLRLLFTLLVRWEPNGWPSYQPALHGPGGPLAFYWSHYALDARTASAWLGVVFAAFRGASPLWTWAARTFGGLAVLLLIAMAILDLRVLSDPTMFFVMLVMVGMVVLLCRF